MTKLTFAVLILFATGLNAPLRAADITGNWIAEITTGFGEPQFARVALHPDGAKLSGSWGTWKLEGAVSGSKVTISLSTPQGLAEGALSGAISGPNISGEGSIALQRGGGGRATGRWRAVEGHLEIDARNHSHRRAARKHGTSSRKPSIRITRRRNLSRIANFSPATP